MNHYEDDLATGMTPTKLAIVGRPREGRTESYVILEEPGEPVQMHWKGRLYPHFKQGCPHCEGAEAPKPHWYLGCSTIAGRDRAILELTWKCFRSAQAASRSFTGGGFCGLVVRISRAGFRSSPRVLRCDQKLDKVPDWCYRTREELCRIWGIVLKPRIYKEA